MLARGIGVLFKGKKGITSHVNGPNHQAAVRIVIDGPSEAHGESE